MKLQVRAYARPFTTPLQTHHGNWSVRRGLILRLESEQGVGWGEVAPIEAFGTESDAAALAFCQALPPQITLAEIQQISMAYPACRFGLEAAWEMARFPLGAKRSSLAPLEEGGNRARSSEVPFKTGNLGGSSLLLPSGRAALESPLLFTNRPDRPSTFKWKIGMAPVQQELEIFEQLVGLLPVGAKLRLDANGGLCWQAACTWLQVCDGYGIEFLEQPLPPEQLGLMQKLSQRYSTPMALDESVTSLAQLQACYARGWRGIFVIKAPLAGSPLALREFCRTRALDLVWSSVFETNVARSYIEQYLVGLLPATERAPGFAVEQWFADGWERRSPEQIWEQLA